MRSLWSPDSQTALLFARGSFAALGFMIFAAETEELSLYVFDGEAEAIAHCEGLDVEAGTWVFWDDQGNPLEAQFTKPNKRGLFSAINGAYTFVPATPDHHAPLSEALEEILHFEGRAPFDSELGVREYLTGACKDGI